MNLSNILKRHEMWLKSEKDGECANLEGANLKCANLKGANLKGADLFSVDLRKANLRGINLEGTDLFSSNLEGANLEGGNLEGADLRNANLKDTNLYGVDLRNANLKGANLEGANLRNANLENIQTDVYTIGYNLACPEEGSFVAYKKAGRCIIKLLVLKDAKRSSATTAKCRCNKAKVLDIENIKTGLKITKVHSDYDPSFIYKVGEIISVDNFDNDRWRECAPGIHFFMNRENAINY